MSEFLFVYGTLRRGQPLYPHLDAAKARFIGEGRIVGRLFDLGEYPGATPDPKRFSTVRGEVHELYDPPRTLAILDDITTQGVFDLATLSVALRELRTLA